MDLDNLDDPDEPGTVHDGPRSNLGNAVSVVAVPDEGDEEVEEHMPELHRVTLSGEPESLKAYLKAHPQENLNATDSFVRDTRQKVGRLGRLADL